MTSEETNEYRRLEELRGSDYEIADGEPDIRGWDIKNNRGTRIGEVHEVLFNPSTRKVRYIVAELEPRIFGVARREILIPIGLAELHEKEDEVYLPELTLSQLDAAPDYIKDGFNFDREIIALNAFKNEKDAPFDYNEQTFYEHDHFNERNFYGRRFINGGTSD